MAPVSPAITLEATAKIFDDGKWKKRHFVFQRSSSGDSGTLCVYKTAKCSRRPRSRKKTLCIDGFFGVESGFSLNDESRTVAVISRCGVIVLAFASQTEANTWEWSIRNAFGSSYQYNVFALLAPPDFSSIANSYVRLHLRDGRFCVVTDSPPRLLVDFQFNEIRRYGALDNKFCVEAGSRTDLRAGVYVFRTGHCDQMAFTFSLAAHCRLQDYLSSDETSNDPNFIRTRSNSLLSKLQRQFSSFKLRSDRSLDRRSEPGLEKIEADVASSDPSTIFQRVARSWRRVRSVKIHSPIDPAYYCDTRPLLKKSTILLAKPSKPGQLAVCSANPHEASRPTMDHLPNQLDRQINRDLISTRTLAIQSDSSSSDDDSPRSPSFLIPRPRSQRRVYQFSPPLTYAKLDQPSSVDAKSRRCPTPKASHRPSFNLALQGKASVQYAEIDRAATQAAREVIKSRKVDVSCRFPPTPNSRGVHKGWSTRLGIRKAPNH